MRKLFLAYTTEFVLFAVIIAMSIVLAFTTDRFITLGNGFDLLNISAVNIIFAVGLLVVLISGGIDISFAVAASVVQYVTALLLERIGGGGWVSGLLIAGSAGIFEIVARLAEAGLAIILISDEVPEVYFNADRIIHMEKGHMAGWYDPRATTLKDLEATVYA